jgi:hypothetical protein
MLIHAPITSVHRNGTTTHTRESCGVLQFVMIDSVRRNLIKHIELTQRMQQVCKEKNIDQVIATRFIDEWIDIRAANETFTVYITHLLIEISKGEVRLSFSGRSPDAHAIVVTEAQFGAFARRVCQGPGVEVVALTVPSDDATITEALLNKQKFIRSLNSSLNARKQPVYCPNGVGHRVTPP